MKRLYDEYIKRLVDVNDETKTVEQHRCIKAEFKGWQEGVKDAAGHTFNGDRYYIALFDAGVLDERPMCCGEFLDWESKVEFILVSPGMSADTANARHGERYGVDWEYDAEGDDR